MVDYGGKTFRRKLLHALIADEDDEVVDELIYEYMIQSGSLNKEIERKSCADEEFTSCDELSEEHDGRSLWINKNGHVFDQRTPHVLDPI